MRLKHINWSEVIRKAILEKVVEEGGKTVKSRCSHRKPKRRIEGWRDVDEIRLWRETFMDTGVADASVVIK